MRPGQRVMRRRQRRPEGGGPRGRWLVVGLLLGLVLLGLSGIGGSALYAEHRYQSILEDVVPPEDLISRYSNGGARIYDRNGVFMYEFVDELGGLRRPVEVAEMSRWITAATISVEDPDFYDNRGINVRGLLRAGVENFLPFGDDDFLEGSGGSSITQQLAKNVYIPREERANRSIDRKVKETVIALELTQRYSKEQILEWYLNSISYGGIYVGIEAASQGYFGKPASDLTLPEASLLAGIPQSPARFDPFGAHNIDSRTGQLADDSDVKLRQADVLDLMVRREAITRAEADEALATPLAFSAQRFEIEAPHFVLGRVADEIRARFGERALLDQGLEVVTTLDLELQESADRIIDEYLTEYGESAGVFNGALVALDPHTGEMLTYVASRDYFDDTIEGRNDNVVALNSPGSTLKPFTYMTAFMSGWGTGTGILDTPVAIASEGATFNPTNPGSTGYLGPVPAALALGNSLNVSAIKTILHAGVAETIGTLKDVGFTSFIDPSRYGPALTTGGSEVTLLDQAIGYSVLATNGLMRGQELVSTTYEDPDARQMEPVALLKVTDFTGEVLYEFDEPEERRIVPAEYPYLATSVLSDGQNTCIVYGVCNALALPNGYPSAAKTGTSEPFANSNQIGETWTMGYTPELVVGTWAGNADNAPISGITSTTVSFRSWRDFMVEALEYLERPATPFTRPQGVVEREVCWPSGRLPTDLCPDLNRYTSLFAAEQIPSDLEGSDMVDTWWQRVPIDTRTGQVAQPGTPLVYVTENVRLVLPEEEVAGWNGLSSWAARWGASGYLSTGSSSTVLITSPQIDQPVGGRIPVLGRADSPDFVRYTLSWGSGAQPDEWESIAESSAPVNGTLGLWDTAGIEEGRYTLRLQVEDEDAGVQEFAVAVMVDPDARPPEGSEAVIELTTPRNGSVVHGAVNIVGIASSSDLSEVRVEITPEDDDDWFEVGRQTSPVLGGIIATWNTITYPEGEYRLRVVLVDEEDGETVEEILVRVDNTNPAPTLTPTPTPAPTATPEDGDE